MQVDLNEDLTKRAQLDFNFTEDVLDDCNLTDLAGGMAKWLMHVCTKNTFYGPEKDSLNYTYYS